MKEFKDRDGRVWKIDLNIGNVFHVRTASDGKFDLLDPVKDMDGKPLQVLLATDLHDFWEVLWHLVEVQAREHKVTAADFGQCMAADCLVEARGVFWREWTDFFHSLRRPDAALSVESQAKAMAAAVKLVTAKVAQIDQAKLTKKIETSVEAAVSQVFGKVQASLDAIQDPTPGDNSI